MYNFEPYNVLLSIATNIAVLLMTASVLQGHIYSLLRLMFTVYVQYIKAQLVISHKSMKTHEVDEGDNQFQEGERL